MTSITRVIPTHDFDGYPDGLTRQAFQKDVAVAVPEHYAKILIAKKAAVRATKSPDKDKE
ncbi:hypothetical protein [Rhizobium ruizarguesonis]|uniref:hypothetical protein n=1 Tax=Rhizobium ruizarguesonis TaxID=2081791 RepID=UPI00102FB6D4|nr:hypothetical protein [Rhizobium ruizarguesonis]TBE67417.1 hypothetical protein ELH00_16240 [Rhizobium ruizarguesonis]